MHAVPGAKTASGGHEGETPSHISAKSQVGFTAARQTCVCARSGTALNAANGAQHWSTVLVTMWQVFEQQGSMALHSAPATSLQLESQHGSAAALRL